DQTIKVYTPAEELYKTNPNKSWDGADATDYHPPKNEMNAAKWKEYHIGYCENVRQEGEYLVGDLLIKDKDSIDLIQN
ncbi:DUF2213 domain-containing protein, partial [Acinetobacter baumannii]|uniref:DUF2213 domain-containing protein n=1 Tax=Acinetobacter baumannii TaxID=470 RepID=UPI000E08CEE8